MQSLRSGFLGLLLLLLFGCKDPVLDYTIYGNLIGLNANQKISVTDGKQTLKLTSNGLFQFDHKYSQGEKTKIDVIEFPAGQFCWLSNNEGTIEFIQTNLKIECTKDLPSYPYGHLQSIVDLTVSSDGQNFLTASYDRTSLYRNIFTKAAAWQTSNDPAIEKVAISSNKGLLALANKEGRLRVWDINAAKWSFDATFAESFQNLNNLEFIRNNSTILLGANDKLYFFSLATKQVQSRVVGPLPDGIAMAASVWNKAKNQVLVSLRNDKLAWVDETSDFRELSISGNATAIVYSRDFQYFATVSGGMISLWQEGGTAPLTTYNAGGATVGIVFGEGKMLFIALENGRIIQWNPDTDRTKDIKTIASLITKLVHYPYGPYLMISKAVGGVEFIQY